MRHRRFVALTTRSARPKLTYMESNHVISAPARDDVPERGVVSDKPGDAKSAVRISLEEAQEMVARYIDPSISLSEELIRDRRAAAARGD